MVEAMTNDLAQHIWSHGEGECQSSANWTDARAEAFVRKAAIMNRVPLHDVPESSTRYHNG